MKKTIFAYEICLKHKGHFTQQSHKLSLAQSSIPSHV